MDKNAEVIDLSYLIKSKINIIQLITFDELWIQGNVNYAARLLQRKWYIYDHYNGLREYIYQKSSESYFENTVDKNGNPIKEGVALVDWMVSDLAHNSIVIINDAQYFLGGQEGNPYVISALKHISSTEKFRKDRAVVFTQSARMIPYNLSKYVYQYEPPLPRERALTTLFKKICKEREFNFDDIDDKIRDSLVNSCFGLTWVEASAALNKIFYSSEYRVDRIKELEEFKQEKPDKFTKDDEKELKELKSLKVSKKEDFLEEDYSIILKEKEDIIRNSGHLEYYPHSENIEDVGGAKELKKWLRQRGRAFSKEARDFGLPTPRGLLLFGIPGTGKSLVAKAVGTAWNYPIIRLDMGKMFGSLVGQSETNIRSSLKIVEALSPSILWIDEIEKGLSGLRSSGATDGGTTSRVLGTFLTWMQEKKAPVFVVATANSFRDLPPELLRKGRFDEIFFCDLPQIKEREEIFEIHLRKLNRDPSKFNIKELAAKSVNFSGAEIEESIKQALYDAYDERVSLKNKSIDITDSHIIKALSSTVPLAQTMSEAIDEMRKWAQHRAIFASGELEEGEERETVTKFEDIKNNFNELEE